MKIPVLTAEDRTKLVAMGIIVLPQPKPEGYEPSPMLKRMLRGAKKPNSWYGRNDKRHKKS